MATQVSAVKIPGDMVQFIPTGWFPDWYSIAEHGAPEWVKHYLDYQGFRLDSGFKVVHNTTTSDYVFVKKSTK